MPVQVSRATGYTSALINTGSMTNKGVEIELRSLRPIVNTGGFTWNLNTNFTYLNNLVTSVYPDANGVEQLGRINIGLANGTASNVFAAVGYAYPALYTSDIQRVQTTNPNAAYYDATGQFAGRPIVDPVSGYPVQDPTIRYLGNTQPKYRFGLVNTFAYKGFQLIATVEYRGGNVIYNSLGSALAFTGASTLTTYNGRQEFIFPNSVVNTGSADKPVYKANTNISTQDGNLGFWTGSGYYQAGSTFVTSADFWKLRELVLSYTVPATFLSKTKFVQSLNIALTGRNLILLRPKSNIYSDPEFSLDNSNAQGQTNEYQNPPTRLYGFRISLGF